MGNAALIVGAGRGNRMKGSVPKQYRSLGGMPIIRRTIAAFLRHPDIATVQAVIHPDDLTLYQDATQGLGLPPPVMGGDTRQQSVHRGLESLAGLAPAKVLIHDAVRPFVEADTISAVLAALDTEPAIIAAMPVTDTLKRCSGNRVTATVDRTDLWRAQTPQGFHFATLLSAHRDAERNNPANLELTDDAAVLELAGVAINVVRGSEDNIKISTEHDLLRAELMLRTGWLAEA